MSLKALWSHGKGCDVNKYLKPNSNTDAKNREMFQIFICMTDDQLATSK